MATRSIIPLKHNSKSPRVQRKAERICGKQGSTPHLREIYGMVATREFFSQRRHSWKLQTRLKTEAPQITAIKTLTVSKASEDNLPPFHCDALKLATAQTTLFQTKHFLPTRTHTLPIYPQPPIPIHSPQMHTTYTSPEPPNFSHLAIIITNETHPITPYPCARARAHTQTHTHSLSGALPMNHNSVRPVVAHELLDPQRR